MKIAPRKSTKNWINERIELANNLSNKSLWESAYSNYFYERLNSRYLIPIERIKNGDKWDGEGFAIMGILCMLVEFCQSFFEGKIYEHRDMNTISKEVSALKLSKKQVQQNGHPYPFYYSQTKKLFKEFLLKQKPFNKTFTTNKLAEDFYKYVRSGLVHEAGTKGNYKIWATGTEIVYPKNNSIIINRDEFTRSIVKYLGIYKSELLLSNDLKRNFLRKVDDISQINRVYYFAYGSNLKESKLIDSFSRYNGLVHKYYTTTLKNYELIFNKKSIDGSAKCNIQHSSGKILKGICYEVDEFAFDKFVAIEEKGYNVLDIPVYGYNQSNSDKYIWAKTLQSSGISSSLPKKSYVDLIVYGGIEKGLDNNWVNKLKELVDYNNLTK